MSALRLRRTRMVAVVVATVVMAGGCRVRTDVELRVDHDGSGSVAVTVTLDREAAAQVPDLASQLRVEDLRRAGWRLRLPRRTSGGGLRVAASKRFERPDQAGPVLEELAGKDGPFRDFTVDRSHSFARTTWKASGTVDLHEGLAAFSDERVTALLGGKPFGRSEEELRLLARGSLADAAPFRVQVRMPGGEDRVFAVRLGDRPLAVTSVSEETNSIAYLLVAAAFAALLAALVLVVLDRSGRRKPPRAQRGIGTYDRQRYQAIVDAEDGPAPGTGGPPELVRIRRFAGEKSPPGPPSAPSTRRSGSRPASRRPGGPPRPGPGRPPRPR